jgi:hypothetical protein
MLRDMRFLGRIGTLLAILATGIDTLAQGERRPEVTAMSFDGSEVVRAFNSASDRVRLVLVLSPT